MVSFVNTAVANLFTLLLHFALFTRLELDFNLTFYFIVIVIRIWRLFYCFVVWI